MHNRGEGSSTHVWWAHAHTCGGLIHTREVGSCIRVWWAHAHTFIAGMNGLMYAVCKYYVVGSCSHVWWAHAHKCSGLMLTRVFGSCTVRKHMLWGSTCTHNVVGSCTHVWQAHVQIVHKCGGFMYKERLGLKNTQGLQVIILKTGEVEQQFRDIWSTCWSIIFRRLFLYFAVLKFKDHLH